MKKTQIKTPEITENRGAVASGILEATAEGKRAILRSRAKRLAREPEKKGETKDYLEALAFLLAHETYAIETRFIREVYPLTELTPLPCTPDYIFGIINIRGQILTILDIKKFIDLPEKGITNLNRIIVVRQEDMTLGILADEIIGIRNISKGGLNPPLPTMTGIHAGYIRGITGEGIILLDMGKFLDDGKLIIHEEVEG
ncbi:MAG: chemotaxis protein CheW [Desulfobacterales bacterium]|nr:chemotaxis protein CheW [Desulfobacterales bacterium]MDD4071623.1 chemotaxis protein CheW [Desulfobacterales bacterium]MDD4391623.1 chemotaxis protein CheW [Desulfobacterales bacterium]